MTDASIYLSLLDIKKKGKIRKNKTSVNDHPIISASSLFIDSDSFPFLILFLILEHLILPRCTRFFFRFLC